MTITKTTPSEPTGIKLTRRGFFLGVSAVAVTVALPKVTPLAAMPESVGFSVFACDTALIRAQIWSGQIKELFLEELTSMKFTNVIGED